MKNTRGQALVFTLVLLPVLIICSRVLTESGFNAYLHYRVQAHIDRLALNALQPQAEALQALGKLNPYAQTIIETRRAIEAAQLAGLLVTKVSLEPARQTLIQAQRLVADVQRSAQTAAAVKSYQILLKDKVATAFLPAAFKFYLEEKSGFKSEVGAPLKLSKNFSQKQNILIQATLKKQMKLKSFAQIEMTALEGPWQIRLRNQTQDSL